MATDVQEPQDVAAALQAFSAAVARRDVNAIMAAMTDDCVWEGIGPAPDGERGEGQAAVRSMWERTFAASPDLSFEHEDRFLAGDRFVLLWKATAAGHYVRGIDVLRVRDGKVSEKLSYVKGSAR
jgi:ketosteroid isomerase-like protein